MANSKNWVDYKEVKKKVSMSMVLNRYEILDSFKETKEGVRGACPIHHGTNSKSFSVSFEKNAWQCFGDCKAGGNVLDFVAKMEDTDLRGSALLIQSWFPQFFVVAKEEQENKTNKTTEKSHGETKKTTEENNGAGHDEKSEDQAGAGSEEKAVPNQPLGFKLNCLESVHPFFEERGIKPETIKTFGLGFCIGGKFINDRIAIPIHNEKGELIAYCGRAVDPEQEEESKYKLPPADGKKPFYKSLLLYNLHQIPKEKPVLVLVESFISVWWLTQNKIPCVVSPMGSSLSEEQEDLILNHLRPHGRKARVIFMFDPDESGEICTQKSFLRLGKELYCRYVDLSKIKKKPHQLSKEEIMNFLS